MALKYYYHALSGQLSKNWLDLWDSLESDGIQYDTDIRDAQLFNDDIAALNTQLAELNKQYGEAKDNINNLNREYEKANDTNTRFEEDKHQYRLAVDCFNGETDSQCYLSVDMLKIFESNLNELVESTIKMGIYLTPGILDVDVMGVEKEQACVYLISKNLKTLKGLCEKIKEVKGKDSSNNGNIIILENRYEEVKEKLVKCVENDDSDGINQYKKEMKSLKNKIDELKFSSSIVTVSDIEKNILDNSIVEKIRNGDCAEMLCTFESVIDKWKQAIDIALRAFIKGISNSGGVALLTSSMITTSKSLYPLSERFLILSVQEIPTTLHALI